MQLFLTSVIDASMYIGVNDHSTIIETSNEKDF